MPPVPSPSPRAESPSDLATRLPVQPQAGGQRLRIVLSAEQAELRESIHRVLSERYDVEVAANTLETLAAVRRQPPALILSDLSMMRLDGFGMLRELRADERGRTVPVLLLSAQPSEESHIEGMDAGADDYLVKPFSARELLARVGSHVELQALRREALAARLAAEQAAALAASEAQLRLVTDAVPALISYVDTARRYRFNNRVFEEWFGHSPAEADGKLVEEVLGADAYREISEHVEMALAGKPVQFESLVPHRHGGMRSVQAAYVSDIGTDGVVKGFFALVSDCTEQKKTETSLRESARRFRELAESLPQLIWTSEPDGRCDFLSQQWVDYTGIPAEQQLGFAWLDRMHPDDRASVQQAWDAAVASGSNFYVESRIRRQDGVYRWFDRRAVPYRNNEGRITKWFGSDTDIEEPKRAQESQLRMRKMEALGTLAGGIAHDFNNILQAIRGNSTLAAGDLSVDHPALESLAEIEKACVRAADLVRRILTFSRQQESRRQVLKLQPIVEEALKLLRSTLPASIELRASYAADVPQVAADTTLVHQTIMNLAVNASHAIGSRNGLIELRLDSINVSADLARTSPGLREGRYVRLSVSDNGCGMDKATQDRVFDPFFTTKPLGEGTGLGLSVVDGIMKSHDGVVNVYSQPGVGTTFRLYFPASDAAAEQVQAKPQPPPLAHGEHLLFVDDEEALVLLATRMLKRLGYQVTGFTNPVKALERFRAGPRDFGAVVTDVSMPGMSGFDLARALLAARPDVPILMTSGYVRQEDHEAALQLGVRALILKPNSVEELGLALDRLFHSGVKT